ncbi:MAG: UvrB/UvrC motif-containing protein [Chitinophagales bacterium]
MEQTNDEFTTLTLLSERATPAQFNSFLTLVTTESLYRCMNKLVEREDYEAATFYRDELIRRGELSN